MSTTASTPTSLARGEGEQLEGAEGVGKLLEEIVDGDKAAQQDPVDILVCKLYKLGSERFSKEMFFALID